MKAITQTFLNACDLYIESIKLASEGCCFSFVWKRGSKVTQSLKYESNGATVLVREMLTLNIRTSIRNGRVQEKNVSVFIVQTELYLLNTEGAEIDQVSLPIHRWRSNFDFIEIPLGGGLMMAKVRLKRLMQVENYVYTNSDLSDQESSEIESIKITPKATKSSNLIEEQKDELHKVRKELEDKIYYSNKLKSDRNILITKNLELEGQLSSLKSTIKEQWSRIERNYKNRIAIRDQVYEE